ncbi:hypothetical protein [Streptomyces flavidovirens]|uniref:hypothetical protein n=1 Tax=Streptomyces flavidovirens TaxID=67298 RepID=UPI0036B29934
MSGTKARPNGSTTKARTWALAALGVVKVATAEQIRQLTCPGTADAQTVRNAAKDLVAEGLVVSLGSATRINAKGNRVIDGGSAPCRSNALSWENPRIVLRWKGLF